MTAQSPGSGLRVLMIDAANQTPAYVYPLCAALASEGCRVLLATAPFVHARLAPPAVPVQYDFARVARMPVVRRAQRLRQVLRGLEYPLDWALVLRRIRATRPDIVHVQWAMVPPVDGLAFRAIRRTGVRLVYTVHDIQPRYGTLRRTLLSTRALYALADALIVHSGASRATLCKFANVSPLRVHVIAHGNMADWSAPPVSQLDARRVLALPLTAPVVLFFGVIKPYKRLDRLLRAMPRVLQQLPDARLMVVGRPAESFAPYRQLIEELGIRDRVMCRLEYVSEAEVARYFGAANVVVLPYAESDASGVLLQAYTFSRPVVVTETNGLEELVEDGVTGLVVRSRHGLAEAIVQLLSDPARAVRMGDRARTRALRQHDWVSSARATVNVYTALARSR